MSATKRVDKDTAFLGALYTKNGIEADGSDTNIDMTLTPKGTGQVVAAAPVVVPTYTVAGAPDATLNAGALIYVSNGDAGSACFAVSDGTDWLVLSLGLAIAAA